MKQSSATTSLMLAAWVYLASTVTTIATKCGLPTVPSSALMNGIKWEQVIVARRRTLKGKNGTSVSL